MIKIVVDKEKMREFWEDKAKPAFLKHWWYCVLFAVTSLYLLIRGKTVTGIGFSSVGNVFFMLWAILILLPLFWQTELFHAKEQKGDSTKEEHLLKTICLLQEQIVLLQKQNSGNPGVEKSETPALPGEEALKETKEQLQEKKFDLYSPKKNKLKIDVTQNTRFLLEVKHQTKNQLKHICEKTQYVGAAKTGEMVHYLYEHNILDSVLTQTLTQVLAICYRGLEGELISEQYLEFIREVYPGLQKQLQLILEN